MKEQLRIVWIQYVEPKIKEENRLPFDELYEKAIKHTERKSRSYPYRVFWSFITLKPKWRYPFKPRFDGNHILYLMRTFQINHEMDVCDLAPTK